MTQAKRRLFVTLMYSSYIAIAILPGLAGLVLFACWLALTGLLKEYGFPGDTRLFTSRDERQTAVRHRAFVRAYAILAAPLCAACVYATIAFDAGPA